MRLQTLRVISQLKELLRERAGVNGAKPTAADPYMVSYFLNKISDPILLEIRRERGVELFMEDTRWDDLMRWKMGELTTIPWEGIYVPAMNTLMDLDGDGKPDVSFVTKTPAKADQVSGVQYREVSKDFALSEGTKGNLQIYHGNIRSWEDYKYVRPIPTNDLKENPNLGQNPGWAK